jgi:hypothetical protein
MPPQMTGLSLNPSPPIALENMTGKVGGFWQVVDDDSRSTTSQVSVTTLLLITPPQIRSLERP